ncbi:hypothetical protein A5883_002335 [Enterococcus sp. 5B3_DIV0040]|nr:hypothetical protein A5883_002335 [Enterococcus sp. 5B3_DIV0040]
MGKYIVTSYDILLQDGRSHVFSNFHFDDMQEAVDLYAHWNEDDTGTMIYELDWLLIDYRINKRRIRNKFVLLCYTTKFFWI